MAVLLPYALPSLPKTQSDDWVRPSDWPVITDTANEIWALVNDQGAAFYSFTANFTGTAFVDWGDGSSPVSITSNVAFTKSYTPGTGATCSRGYTTFKVRIYGATTWTSVRPTAAVGTAANGSYLGGLYSTGLLEMYYGDGVGVGTAGSYFASTSSSTTYNFQQLEYVKFPSTVSSSSFGITTMFRSCQSLQKVVLPDTITGSAISFADAFRDCPNLKSITMPSSGSISSLSSTFTGCSNLKSVIFPASNPNILASATTIQSAFFNCYNLVSIDLPAITAATTLTTAFQACSNLRYFRTQGAPSGVSVTATSMFISCSSLEQVIFVNPASASTFSAATMFQNCYSLKNITFADKILFNTMNGMFTNCYSIQRVEFQATSMPLLTVMTSAFSGCQSLISVILPTSGSSGVAGDSMLLNCQSIGTFSSTINFANTSSMFSGCSNIKSVSLPNIGATTTCNSMFGSCYNLTDVTLPSTLTACNNFGSMFANCYSLKSFTLPAITTTGSATNVNAFAAMFQNCFSLRNVAFTSFGSYTYSSMSLFFNNMFSGCYSLQSVDLSPFNSLTLAPTLNSDITQGTAFNNCWSLKTLKWGIPIQSNIAVSTNIATTYTSCASLTNLDLSSVYATASNNLVWQAIGTATTNIPQVQGMTFSCKFTRFQHYGTTTIRYNLQNLRLTNTAAGQYGGASPQIDVSYTLLGQAALVQLFNDLPTLTSKTINITGCPGASLLTAGERAIATGKGWTITG